MTEVLAAHFFYQFEDAFHLLSSVPYMYEHTNRCAQQFKSILVVCAKISLNLFHSLPSLRVYRHCAAYVQFLFGHQCILM